MSNDEPDSIGTLLRDFDPLEHDRDEYLSLDRLGSDFQIELGDVVAASGISPGGYVDVQVDLEGQFPMFVLGDIGASDRQYASYTEQIGSEDGHPVAIPEVRVSNIGVDTDRYPEDDPLLLYPIAFDEIIALLVVDFESAYYRERNNQSDADSTVQQAVEEIETPAGFSAEIIAQTSDVMGVPVDPLTSTLRAVTKELEAIRIPERRDAETVHRFEGSDTVGFLIDCSVWKRPTLTDKIPDEVGVEAIKFAHELAVEEAAQQAGSADTYRRDHGIYPVVATPT